jgi:uncharacterized protein
MRMRPDPPTDRLPTPNPWSRAFFGLALILLAACNHKSATRPATLAPEPDVPAARKSDAPAQNQDAPPSQENGDMQPQMNLPRTSVTLTMPDGRRITLVAQKAVTEAQKAKGLMFRSSLPESEGMLFLYDHEEELGFYMANCYLSLDMIFMNRDKVVVGIVKRAKPMDPTVLSIGKPSQYVLEVNGGFTDRHVVEPGTRVAWE